MKKARHVIATVLTISLVFILVCGVAEASVTASDYLEDHAAALASGDETGEVYIYFDVTATRKSDSLGVSKIKIYHADGGYVTTIYGSTQNNLIRENFYSHTGLYSYYGTSGESYYAEVTIFAARGGGSDSRTITTNVVTAP